MQHILTPCHVAKAKESAEKYFKNYWKAEYEN